MSNRYVTLALNWYRDDNAPFRTADNKMLFDHLWGCQNSALVAELW